MTMVSRRAGFVALLALVASPLWAETATKSPPESADTAELERPALFDLSPRTGSLKETVQKGQELIFRRKDGERERQFRLDNISVALLRSETGAQVKITFSGNVTSQGYSTSEDAKLTLAIRTGAGAALHSWQFGISVKCGDDKKPIAPLTHDMPTDIAANAFANAAAVEIAEYREPNASGVPVRRCG
jgi:hypothetical protein